MTHESRWRRYLRFWRHDVAADLDDELAYHFEQRVQQFMAAGLSRDAAEANARERFGDIARSRAEILDIDAHAARSTSRASIVDALVQDVKFTFRALRRSPGLAIACIVTIALGVGANGAMFTLADRLFLRPPDGVADPDAIRRFYVRTMWGGAGIPNVQSEFSYQAFVTLDSGLAERATLAAYTKPDSIPFRVTDGEPNRIVYGSYVTGDYMSMLGIRPAVGRFFASDETQMGQPKLVAIISHQFWQRQFDADRGIIGTTIDVNRQRMTIIGVAPPGFSGTDLSGTDVWMPLPTFPAPAEGMWYKHWAGWRFLRIVGRVVAGTRDEWLANAATTIVRRDLRGGERSRTNVVRDSTARMLTGPILESLGPSMHQPPELAIATRLVGVTLIVLIIACANVASLLLARAMTRRREIAVRLALGVSRSRLMTQLAVEGVVLAVLASAAALLVGAWAGASLRALVMPNTHWTQPLLDVRVTMFTLLVAIAAGLAAGLVPALHASDPELSSALKTGSRGGGAGSSRTPLRAGLLVAQIALSVVLLYGAGLFARSLSQVRAIDLRVDPERLVYATAWMTSNDGPYVDWFELENERIAITRLQEIAAELRAQPEVESVAMASYPPMLGHSSASVFLADGSAAPQPDNQDSGLITATSSYFAATGIAMFRGRGFADTDRGSRVVVVNETAARAYWPNADPIGQCLRVSRDTMPCSTVIGVMKSSHLADVIEKPTAQVVSLASASASGAPIGTRYLLVRTAPDRADDVVQSLRAEVRKRFPPSSSIIVTSMADAIAPQLRPWTLGATIFSAFGLLALVIAALGTYSVIAYSVNQRAHEMSVRTALGARAADVLRLIVGQGVRIASLGIIAGVAVSIVASRLIASLLYETSPRDPLVGIAVAALLAFVAVIASGIPAWRATRADPVVALRSE